MLKVDKTKCDGCELCCSTCPVGAPKISPDDGKTDIDIDLCMECYACMSTCPNEAIYEED